MITIITDSKRRPRYIEREGERDIPIMLIADGMVKTANKAEIALKT